MKVVRFPAEMKNVSLSFRASGKSVGLVPTMGNLHEGHLSLLERVRPLADITVMSIFVNPTQFGQGEDFDTYPRTFDEDCRKSEEAGCDILFAPHNEDMYPKGFDTLVSVGNLSSVLCGASRPGHFSGVATVVLKLFGIVQPHVAVFGQKDAQQAIVLRRMVEDLNLSVNLVVAPIVRESDGLAMSSRNGYLTKLERTDSTAIFQALDDVKVAFEKGERAAASLRKIVEQRLDLASYLLSEYIEIVDLQHLESIDVVNDKALVAVACRTTESNTRLIDNIMLGGEF